MVAAASIPYDRLAIRRNWIDIPVDGPTRFNQQRTVDFVLAGEHPCLFGQYGAVERSACRQANGTDDLNLGFHTLYPMKATYSDGDITSSVPLAIAGPMVRENSNASCE